MEDYYGYEDIDYDNNIPSYRVSKGNGKLRGRPGMDDLFKLVSSKNALDVTRKSAWIAEEPFKVWNEKDIKNYGKQRYYGKLEDYDEDGFPIEYVIRRGGENGPIVAVNGYTIKTSDYPWKQAYYNAYPTSEQRKETTYRQFIRDKYGAEYDDDNMSIKGYKLDPEKDEWTQKVKSFGYRYPVPKDRTPYQAFAELITHPLIKSIIANIADSKGVEPKEIRKEIGTNSGYGLGFASVICSDVYDAFINAPIYDFLNSNGLMNQYKEIYEAKKKETNSEFTFNEEDEEDMMKFTEWLKTRKEFKKAAKKRAVNFLKQDNLEATIKHADKIIKKSLKKWVELG